MTTKLCFVDAETTGLKTEVNSIFELAMIIDIDNKMIARFCQNASPYEDDEISQEALEVTEKTEEEIRSYENTQQDLFELAHGFLTEHVDVFNPEDKLFFVGYNAYFDYRFMRALWEEQQDQYFGSIFWFPYIDMMSIVGWATLKERVEMNLPNFKLYTVARALGLDVKESNLHTAMYDVRLARMIYYKLEA